MATVGTEHHHKNPSGHFLLFCFVSFSFARCVRFLFGVSGFFMAKSVDEIQIRGKITTVRKQ